MSLISRLTVWTIGQVLKAADLNGEFNNVTNLLNNLDAATSTWTNVKVVTLNATTKATVPNGASATDAAAFGQVKVLQVVTASTTTNTSTTSSTYQAATNLSAAITPTSASNRILIIVSVNISLGTGTHSLFLTIKRGATDISLDSTRGFVQMTAVANAIQIAVPLSFIDSPATTSATTYAVFLKNDDNATTVQVNANTATSTITLLEVV